MKRGSIILLFALLLTGGIVSAEEGISFTEINSTTILYPGELGHYTLLLENLGAQELKLQIQAEPYVGLPSNDFDYVFVEPNYVELQGHEQVEVEVNLKLKEDVVRQKRYKTYVTAESLNLEEPVSALYNLEVFAMPPQDAIDVSLLDSTERVGPGGEFSVSLELVNKLPQDLSNVDVYVSSDLFEDKQTIELFQEQEKEASFSFTIPQTAAPGEYSFNARVYFDEELSGSVGGSFVVDEDLSVSEYNELVTGFLYEMRTVTITNNGNTAISDSYEQSPSFFESLFSSYSLEADYTEEGNPSWAYTLAPEEKFMLQSTEDYRPLVVAIVVVLLLGFMAYYLFTKRVTVKKETFKLKYSTDGISEFKVLLHLKNNTNKAIKDISIVDVLPKLIQPKTNFGTLHPSGIERGDKGIRIMWKIPELVSGEERIISYEVDAQFKVIGDISLPNTTVKYKTGSNRVVHIRSNKAHVVSGIVAEEESPGDRPATAKKK